MHSIVDYPELINRDIARMGISRDELFDALDGIFEENELFDFLCGRQPLSTGAIYCILLLLENISCLRVTRKDPESIISRTGRIVRKSKPGSVYILGNALL